MALDRDGLVDSLTAFFSEPPDSVAGCAQEWATSVQDYATNIVPTSTTVAAAAATLQATLSGIFSTSLDASTTAAQLELAFLAFATTVGGGMAPAYTFVPPSGSVGFLALFGETPATNAEAATNFADAIDTWMKTGTATQTSSPFTTVNWS